MSNVKTGMGGGGMSMVPAELRLGTMVTRMPPNTIESQVNMAKGKAGMNFKHPPLGPEHVYEDSEMGDVARTEDGGGAGMLNANSGSGNTMTEGKSGGGKAKGGGGKKPRHRSTSGVPGHTVTGV